jgi:hypothetical protein
MFFCVRKTTLSYSVVLKQWINTSDVDMVESGTCWLSTHDIKIMIWIVFFSLSFFLTEFMMCMNTCLKQLLF